VGFGKSSEFVEGIGRKPKLTENGNLGGWRRFIKQSQGVRKAGRNHHTQAGGVPGRAGGGT
jgi:hypothetical protein